MPEPRELGDLLGGGAHSSLTTCGITRWKASA
jgi:hypothetical protein